MALQEYFSPELMARVSPGLSERANDVLGIIDAYHPIAAPDVAEEALLSCLLGVLYESECLEETFENHFTGTRMPAVVDKLKSIVRQLPSEPALSACLKNAGVPSNLVTAARWCEGRFKNGAPLLHSAALLSLIKASASPMVPVDESISLDFDESDSAEVTTPEPEAPKIEVLDMLEYAKKLSEHAGIGLLHMSLQERMFLESENALINQFANANDKGKEKLAIALFLIRLGYLLRFGTPLLVATLLINERTKRDSSSFGEVLCGVVGSRVSRGEGLSEALKDASIPDSLCGAIAAAEEKGGLDVVLTDLGTCFAAERF